MNDELIISICGDVCSECPRYTATKANDYTKLNQFADLWYRLGFRETVVSPESLKCYGCSRDMYCSNGINDCEHLGNKNTCGECDYFPCKKISLVFQKTDELNNICKEKCTDGEYRQLSAAFLRKRQLLTEINIAYKANKK